MRRAKVRCDLVVGNLVSQAGMVKDEKHRQIVSGLDRPIGLVWINERHVKSLYLPSVRLQLKNATVRLGGSNS